MRERNGFWIVVLMVAVLGGAACQGAEQGAEEATPPGEAATADAQADAGGEVPLAVPVDTVNDGRSVARRLEDATVAARVRKALVEEPTLRPFDFVPIVERGRVTLKGEVETATQRQKAAELARAQAGVTDVVNVVNAVNATAAPGLAEAEPRPSEVAPVTPAPVTPAPVTPRTVPTPGARPPTAAAEQPVAEKPAPKPAEKTGETVHTVRNGESLWTISQRYGVTVDDIKRLNGMRSNALMPGQKLRVK